MKGVTGAPAASVELLTSCKAGVACHKTSGACHARHLDGFDLAVLLTQLGLLHAALQENDTCRTRIPLYIPGVASARHLHVACPPFAVCLKWHEPCVVLVYPTCSKCTSALAVHVPSCRAVLLLLLLLLLLLVPLSGLNMLNQAREFNDTVPLTGLILTKLDGTARGGAVVSVVDQLKLPVKFIGVGETPEDLQPFDAKNFAEALFPSSLSSSPAAGGQ